MHPFAFISRRQPTEQQHQLAAEKDIKLIHIGDHYAFTITRKWVESNCPAHIDELMGVVVEHLGAALRLQDEGFVVGMFENANRAEIGQPPSFEAVALHLYNNSNG